MQRAVKAIKLLVSAYITGNLMLGILLVYTFALREVAPCYGKVVCRLEIVSRCKSCKEKIVFES